MYKRQESTSSSEGKKFEAHYHVDKNGGGTLSVGGDTGNNSVTYTVTDPSKSITVTAVPADGYVFVKWSDGLTSKTRTDTDFKQNPVSYTHLDEIIMVKML